jgi:DNA-binding protein HU-beta
VLPLEPGSGDGLEVVLLAAEVRDDLAGAVVDLAVQGTIDEITAQIAAGNGVKFTGFGKFTAVAKPAPEGRNPQTGETMKIAAKAAPRFSAGAELKKAVNG